MPSKRTTPSRGPRFCPACRREAPDDCASPLCGECGDTLIRGGYCPICERYWSLAAGMPCPKHDLPLEAEPPSLLEPHSPGRSVSWVTIWTFPDTLAAAAPRIRLEAEGIPTFLEGERMGSPSMYRVAIGGVKLQVPAELADDARVILSQSWALPFEDDDDFDDAWKGAPPDPGPVRHSLVKELILAILIAPAILWLLVRLFTRD